jgi:hypothetical protein
VSIGGSIVKTLFIQVKGIALDKPYRVNIVKIGGIIVRPLVQSNGGFVV